VALQNDNFDDNSLDAFWTVCKHIVSTVLEQNQQLECDMDDVSSTHFGGVVTTDSHDLTTCDIQVDVDNDHLHEQAFYICLTKVTSTRPHDEDDWYKIMKYNHTDDYYVQKKKAGGAISTLATGNWTGEIGSLRITISGGTIKFYEEANERHSESYDLSSYTAYVYLMGGAGKISPYMDVFDNFLGSSEGAAGLSIPIAMHHYKQMAGAA